MKKNVIFDLTLTSVFAAIIVIMIFVPGAGFIPLTPFVSVTIIHIPVLIGVFILPKRNVVLLGLLFGMGSWMRSFTPMGPLDFAFQYPWISVLPRLLFAVAAIYLYQGLKIINNKAKNSDVYLFGIVVLVTTFGLYYAAIAIADFTNWNQEILMPITLFVIAIFITMYFSFVKAGTKEKMLIPATLIISTIIHTLLVLTALVLFVPQSIRDLFATDDLFGVIISIAVTNGLIEAFAAVSIGTPIILALNKVKESREES